MNFGIIVDTGYWIALFHPRKEPKKHAIAQEWLNDMNDCQIIIPFPTLYEFVDSRLSRRPMAQLEFDQLLYKPNVNLLPDEKYKEEALSNFFYNKKFREGDFSLVDEVIKLIITDVSIKTDFIATFDQGLVNFAIANRVRSL